MIEAMKTVVLGVLGIGALFLIFLTVAFLTALSVVLIKQALMRRRKRKNQSPGLYPEWKAKYEVSTPDYPQDRARQGREGKKR
jgi:hypothetical protein